MFESGFRRLQAVGFLKAQSNSSSSAIALVLVDVLLEQGSLAGIRSENSECNLRNHIHISDVVKDIVPLVNYVTIGNS